MKWPWSTCALVLIKFAAACGILILSSARTPSQQAGHRAAFTLWSRLTQGSLRVIPYAPKPNLASTLPDVLLASSPTVSGLTNEDCEIRGGSPDQGIVVHDLDVALLGIAGG